MQKYSALIMMLQLEESGCFITLSSLVGNSLQLFVLFTLPPYLYCRNLDTETTSHDAISMNNTRPLPLTLSSEKPKCLILITDKHFPVLLVKPVKSEELIAFLA